ncbi:uncharacterized protein LOC110458740 isoform X2 [Mizuhopecten yessoensis]|uniref:uncharacterized protein LOC110458740 isoform X2 n=1 Tax=Mizuhopecten yessoensis TaxID=6573 RepID=UPI000B45E98F|nr:uncharacterized protein LOC110458740 isoform X2 [Mizuhopecten yessoensis]
MYAAGGGHHALVQRILSLSSVDIHATDDDGCTALHKCQSLDTSWEYLVKAGLSQKNFNKNGRSPIQEVSKTSKNIRKGNVGQLIAEGFVKVADVALKAYSGNALQQYLLLFNGVTEKYRHIRVVFLGPEGAGKTTLCQRLQRAQVDMSQRCPTNGGNIYQQLFKVEMDTKRWLRMEIELAITGRFGVLFKENQVLESNVTKEIIEEDVDDTVWTPSTNRHRSGNLDYAKLQEEGPTCGKALALMSPEETRNAMASRTGNRRDDVKWNTDAETTLTTKLEQMVPLFNKIKRDFSLEAFTSKVAADTSPESFAFLSLWDMGGHFALQPSVHVFISGHGVYIITINMLECLQDEREVEKIRNWIRIVGTVSSHYTTNKRRQSHPPIIIVGTHMDLVRQKFKDQLKREQRIKNLEDAICRLPETSKNKGRTKYSFLHFLKVDNSIQDDPVFEKLREIILDAAELQDQWMREIPANWISLEREILHTRTSYPVLTLEEVAELDANCEKPIEDKAAISLFLEFLDCNRSVIYTTEFDTVITNPQWLLDAFSVVITDVQFMPNETNILLKSDLQLYQEKGLLTHSLVQELFEKSGNETHRNHLDIILKHFVWFGMIVKNVVSEHKFGQSGDDNAYIVPSKLETLANSNEIEYVIQTEARIVTKTLCFQFKGDLIPLETFDKVYAGILQEYDPLRLTSRPCPDNWFQKITYISLGILKDSEEKETKSIYRNFGCFAVDDSTNMIVSMHWEQSCIAITLFSHIDNTIPGTVAPSIRRKLDDIIKKTLGVCKQDNIAYEYKLHCSYQIDHGDKPRDRTAILGTEGGVQCLGKECGRKHNLCKEDWIFWLPDLGGSPAQDSKTQTDIKHLHAEMIRKLSLYINPRLPEDWKTFQTSMEQHLGRVDIFGIDVTGLSDICRTLMDKHIIRYGEYAALRSSVEDIHVKATTIIDDATSEIDKIKHQGQ